MTFWILWNEASDRPPKVKFTDLDEARKGALAMARKHGGTFHVMASCDDARGEEKVVRTMEVTTSWPQPGTDRGATKPYAQLVDQMAAQAADVRREHWEAIHDMKETFRDIARKHPQG